MATPALLRDDVMLPSIFQSLRAGSYISTQRRAWVPSKPPTTNSLPIESQRRQRQGTENGSVWKAGLAFRICGLTCMNGDGGPSASHIHGSYQSPGVVLGVVALHGVQAIPRLCPSDRVHEAVQLAHCCLVPPWNHIRSMNTAFHLTSGCKKSQNALWIHTDVEGGTVGPGFGHRVKSVTVLQTLLPAGIRPSHNIEFVVQGADAFREMKATSWTIIKDFRHFFSRQGKKLHACTVDPPALQRLVLSSGTWVHSSVRGSYFSPQLSSSECPFEPPIT